MSANAAPTFIQQEPVHTPGFASTGPRTVEGKAIASQNAVKHGLCSSKLILPGESQAEFESLRQDLFAEYQPGNTTETLLVDQFAVDTWRLQRTRRNEAAFLSQPKLKHGVRIMEASPNLNMDELNKLARYQTSIERSYHRTLAALRKILAERHTQTKRQASLADYNRTYDQAFEDAVESLIAPPSGWDSHFVSQYAINSQFPPPQEGNKAESELRA